MLVRQPAPTGLARLGDRHGKSLRRHRIAQIEPPSAPQFRQRQMDPDVAVSGEPRRRPFPSSRCRSRRDRDGAAGLPGWAMPIWLGTLTVAAARVGRAIA